jgi:hypothetical protein
MNTLVKDSIMHGMSEGTEQDSSWDSLGACSNLTDPPTSHPANGVNYNYLSGCGED